MTHEERAQFIAEVASAVRSTGGGELTEEERQWVRLAIQREAQSIKLRQAVIEKTISSLLWSLLVGVGFLVLDYLKNGGGKA